MTYRSPGPILAVFIAFSSSLLFPLQAQEGSGPAPILWEELIADEFETQEEWNSTVREFIGHGDEAIHVLEAAMRRAGDDDERTDITYFLALIVSQGRLPGSEPVALPPALVTQLGGLLTASNHEPLRANIANIAAVIGPDAAPMATGLLDLLRHSEDRNLRATTQYALGAIGEEGCHFFTTRCVRATTTACLAT